MESNRIDRANHVPEVSPEDVWGDAAGFHFDAMGTAKSLPPKRVREAPPSSAAANGRNGPLRIESRPQNQTAGEPSPGLEVQEISGSVLRLNPEESEVTRIPRQVTFHERPARPIGSISKNGEAREWGHSKKQSIIWIFGTGMAVAAMVVGALMLLPLVNESNAARPRPGQTELVLAPEEGVKDSSSMNDMLARQAESERIFHAFISAPSADEVLPLVRDPAAMEQLIRANPRPFSIAGNQSWKETYSWSASEKDGLTCGVLKGSLPDHSKFNAYFVISGKQLLLDWKASTAYGTASFEELERKTGTPDEIRAWIEPSDFYTLAFPESDFQCYRLVSPDHQKTIWTYGRRGEAANGALNDLFKQGDILKAKADPEKITLRLESGPVNALPNQWLIGEVLHKDWISP